MKTSTFNVVNFHLTETCNYRCTYCFAKFDNPNELSLEGWMRAVVLVNEYFKSNSIQDGRINLAGGEPLLVKFLDSLIDYIHELGIHISIITNASMLSIERVNKWIGKVSIIGVSIDSLDNNTNLQIGRSNRTKTLDIEQLIKTLKYAKLKKIKLKVNTVVSKLNIHESIMPLYDKVQFDRIKLLQMRVNKNSNDESESLMVTKEEFDDYCNKIKKELPKVVIESESDMDSSYVIVDPYGNIISNKDNIHIKAGSIFNDTLESSIEKAQLKISTFNKRYTNQGGFLENETNT